LEWIRRVLSLPLVLGAVLFTLCAKNVKAKTITKNQAEMCRWGAKIARGAQQSKLSGKTLFSTRRHFQQSNYSRPWMKKMAIGITEQTFSSRSRVSPKTVEQTYYEGCKRHELALK
jgi:hypothetical protein